MLLPPINLPTLFPTNNTTSEVVIEQPKVPVIPYYSQFTDITSANWQKKGCGIASLAMLIDYYKPGNVAPQTLLVEGINAGAYTDAGWSHQGLANLAAKHGLVGTTYDLSTSGTETAFARFTDILADGPVIASVHYKLDPKNPIPHLVVINGIDGDTIYYNDPAAHASAKTISVSDFQKAWKKRFISIRPRVASKAIAIAAQ